MWSEIVTSAFILVTVFALPGWAALISSSKPILATKLTVALLAIAYLVTLAFYYATGGVYPISFAALRTLCQSPLGLLAMWIHYLAVDLIAGLWEFQDAKTVGIARFVLAACLVATMLQGPGGVLLYLIAKKFTAISQVQRLE